MRRTSVLILALMMSQGGLARAIAADESQVPDAPAESSASEQQEFFEQRIRPLLHARCVKCHGENAQKGGLRLDAIDTILSGGESGAALVPGDPDRSLLMEAVRYESFEMPPDNPLSPAEIARLEKWIADGAFWPKHEGQSVRIQGTSFTDEERSLWSLQPLKVVDVPNAGHEWALNEIDHFVAAKLEASGLQPAPTAPAGILVRRLSFGIRGLPPSEELLARAGEPDARDLFPGMIDEALADPAYGEHWGRYWLDVAGYAESDGFRADDYRPTAWRYRDYVVNALNNDKPYDVFVTEQLAGDELSPERAEALVATGFMRSYLYEWNQRDARTQRQDILNQMTDLTGEVFLGFGVGCARCHDHKFDPILQEDYFRLQACFAGTLPCDDIPAADLAERERYERELREWEVRTEMLREQIAEIQRPHLEKSQRSAIGKFPDDIQAIMAKDPGERNAEERQLADLVTRQFNREFPVSYSDAEKKRIEELEQQLEELAPRPAPLPAAITIDDVGNFAAAVHIGADASRREVQAGGLSIINPAAFELPEFEDSTGRRTALARWITDPENPLTARVIVNRVWQKHFGRGLVETASDFGTLGRPPTHPELLDWLAVEFMKHGWSLKWLHRKILNSATWQMSSVHPDAATAERIDPANDLRWQFPVRRLEAEQVRDAMLSVSGELQSEIGGPSRDFNALRRSLYLKAMRNNPESLLKSLDAANGLTSTARRAVTTTPTQALQFMNGDWVRARAEAMGRRLLAGDSNADFDRVSRQAFDLAYGRQPDPDELAACIDLLRDAEGQSAEATLAGMSRLSESITEEGGSALRIGPDQSEALIETTEPLPLATGDFEISAVVQLDSLYPDASVRTIVSQWNGGKEASGWSLGVTSEKSAYKPNNLIMQIVGKSGYEVIASDLRLPVGTAYRVAAVVRPAPADNADDTPNGGDIVFRLQPLNGDEASMQSAKVPFGSSFDGGSRVPLAIGGRTANKHHRWDGLIDDVTITAYGSSGAAAAELAGNPSGTDESRDITFAAVWNFDNAEEPFRNTAGDRFDLTSGSPSAADLRQQAVTELCHILLNSNEFLYLD